MKKGYVFTLLFMLIVSAGFTAMLAGANALARDSIEANQALDLQRSLLYALEVPNDGTDAGIRQAYADRVAEAEFAGRTLPARKSSDGSVSAYAFPFKGPGLWGSIEGYLGLSADGKTLTGIVFTLHSETPGLGGRIDEEWFKAQFRGLPVSASAPLTYKDAAGAGDIDAITGATSTSRAVMTLVNGTVAGAAAKGGN
jgi:Na+-transporting NADH:ubiquinone oxidoreductase subunit C